MTDGERLQNREKAILYIRHRRQKGFLSREEKPKEDEMSAMADFFSQLESYENLEPSIIRATKVHKVLKAIVKLSSIPKDEDFDFKKRSAAMLEIWNKRMEAETESAPASAVEPKGDSTAALAGAEKKEESEKAETNGEEAAVDSAAAAPIVSKTIVPVLESEDATETKGGAQEEIVVEEKAEEAADRLDAKLETVAADKMDV